MRQSALIPLFDDKILTGGDRWIIMYKSGGDDGSRRRRIDASHRQSKETDLLLPTLTGVACLCGTLSFFRVNLGSCHASDQQLK